MNDHSLNSISSDPALDYVALLGFSIYDWILLFAAIFLAIELLDDALHKRLTGGRLAETLSSIATQIPFYFSEVVIFASFMLLYFHIYDSISWQLPISVGLIIAVIFAADFIYYWEHRAAHRIRLLWLGHSVHHSSPLFNTATAFRFSLFDPIVSGLFHLPLVLLGVHPIAIFVAEILVQAYQFWIHNEMIGKLGPLDKLFNTPSNHRVHHGSDTEYIDKNYGGILIIWDRLFGTYQAEQQRPTYGLTTPINTVNPFKVQFFEFVALFRDLHTAPSIRAWLSYWFKPPGWHPAQQGNSTMLSNPWVLLAISTAAMLVASTLVRHMSGYTDWPVLIGVLIFMAISWISLDGVVLGLGWAIGYSLWAVGSALGTLLIGFAFYQEANNLWHWLAVLFIGAGVASLIMAHRSQQS